VQLEEPYIVQVPKLMEYVDSKEGPVIQVDGMHQYSTYWTLGQPAASLRAELQRDTRQIEDKTAQKKERWQQKKDAWRVQTYQRRTGQAKYIQALT
jgi:hypothetical protein